MVSHGLACHAVSRYTLLRPALPQLAMTRHTMARPPTPHRVMPRLPGTQGADAVHVLYLGVLGSPGLGARRDLGATPHPGTVPRYRARVEKVESPAKVHVFYIDYGNVSAGGGGRGLALARCPWGWDQAWASPAGASTATAVPLADTPLCLAEGDAAGHTPGCPAARLQHPRAARAGH